MEIISKTVSSLEKHFLSKRKDVKLVVATSEAKSEAKGI